MPVVWRALSVMGIVLVLAAAARGAAGPEDGEYARAVMSEWAFYQLAAVHELMDAGDYDKAIAKLKRMHTNAELSPYEGALVLQTYGYIYVQQAQYARAIRYFEECIATGGLPPLAGQGMLYSLAGMYASEARWLEAATTLETWMLSEPEPSAEAFILIATSYAELKRFDDALPWVEKAIAAEREPRESWYQLLIAIYFDTADFASAALAARQMIARWPENKGYWEMLHAAYLEAGDDVSAMSALELGYRKGVLVSADQIVNLARMKLYLDVPFHAGELLENEMAAGRVARDERALRLVLSAWEAAREFDRAIAVIDELAEAAPDGGLYLRKAQLLAERNRWAEVVAAADEALSRGGLGGRQRGHAMLLKGVAQLEQQQPADAGRTFRQARKLGGRTAEEARSWLEYLQDQAS